ncbi:hypothetical protein [uncultured Oscillibacter sp.]|uniref:hypothetical protein n=1 Tax=uncultured Oscillibacter sp. TaxID=876091 RepID=UPI0025D85B1B|nr:hypothetical protein [uncultured Oscillibacter sp.]
MSPWLSKLGTNRLLLLIDLLGVIEFCLFFFVLIYPHPPSFAPWVISMIWGHYLAVSWILGHVMMYPNGTFAIEANPPLKAGCYKWFLIIYIPHMLFSLLLAACLCLHGHIWAAMADLLLLIFKMAIMLPLNQILRKHAKS